MSIRIGELAKSTGTTVETIRYYEKEGLLPAPTRSAGNYRLYDDRQLERLQFIVHCRSLDMSLHEIRTLLAHKDNPQQNCADINHLLDDHIQNVANRIRELTLLQKHLTALRQQCQHESSAKACGILNALVDNPCR